MKLIGIGLVNKKFIVILYNNDCRRYVLANIKLCKHNKKYFSFKSQNLEKVTRQKTNVHIFANTVIFLTAQITFGDFKIDLNKRI
jgi:nitrate reductase beta subunit